MMAETSETFRPDTRYTFAIKAGGPIFLLTDTELGLSDEGISYSFKGRSGLRSFSALKSVRLQLLSPVDWMGLVELQFMRGASLFVYSKVQANGGQERNEAFAAFVKDLHRRLPSDDKKRIAFRRGISPARHWLVIGATAVFAAGLVFLLGMWLIYRISWTEILFPVIGSAVFTAGFYAQIKTLRPGTYDPENLPRDLLGPYA